MFRLLVISVVLFASAFNMALANPITCPKRIINPITDICWVCFLPIQVGPLKIPGLPGSNNGDIPAPPVCACPAPPPVFVRPGIGFSFWEPYRVAEIVRQPFCSPTFGTTLAEVPFLPHEATNSHIANQDVVKRGSFHMHWFPYPVLSQITQAIGMTMCTRDSDSAGMFYFTELDPTWQDDSLAVVMNPDALLFANPVAAVACAADGAKAATTLWGFDTLFWCAGSQGNVFPLSGNVNQTKGTLDVGLNLLHKHIFKMHRMLLELDTSSPLAMCMAVPQPILRKKQYKQQMIAPLPIPVMAFGLGVPTLYWGAGRHFPFQGEDYSYLIWRKNQCCAL